MRLINYLLFVLLYCFYTSGVSGFSLQTNVPDMKRRKLMNSILLYGGVLPSVSGLAIPYVLFFVPKTKAGGSGGVLALDRNGNAVDVDGWVSTHGANSKALVQGLRGDATYLLTNEEKNIEDYAVNAVCTHLGCVVPWNSAENKFMCPCHGSQYDNRGKVVRGPAPLSLALAKVNINSQSNIELNTWTDVDFRTGLAPWWK